MTKDYIADQKYAVAFGGKHPHLATILSPSRALAIAEFCWSWQRGYRLNNGEPLESNISKSTFKYDTEIRRLYWRYFKTHGLYNSIPKTVIVDIKWSPK